MRYAFAAPCQRRCRMRSWRAGRSAPGTFNQSSRIDMHPNITAVDGAGPFAGVFQAPGRSGGILTEAQLQEGISYIDLPITEVSRLWNGQLPSTRVAIVSAVPSPPDKVQLGTWVNQGGGLVIMNP